MQDIRLVDNDGEYLNLETQSGEKFRLVLDDSLRSTIKRESQLHLDTVSISPREIQDLVRSGLASEQVASEHAVPLDYVEKFALTVVDEIGHVIASAQTVRISVEADRYSEASQIEFGEILEGRLRKAGASNITWSATKLEGEPWMVSVTYDSPQGNHVAVWSFDQRKLVLSPENESAAKFSAGDFAANTPSPKLRQVEPVSTGTRVIDLPRAEVSSDEESKAALPASPAPAISSIEELTLSSLESVAEANEAVEALTPESLSPTADLLEALRKKRAAASETAPHNGVQSEAEPSAETQEQDIVQEPAVTQESQVGETVEEIAAAPIAPAAKKGRPSMPSWDEIVFGTKADD